LESRLAERKVEYQAMNLNEKEQEGDVEERLMRILRLGARDLVVGVFL
jgi:hypothetical protein